MTASQAFAVFHLNLAFSSVPEEARSEVVRRCYHPLLDLVDAGYPFGIELTGWTLERLTELDALWVERLGAAITEGRCELIGSGHVQLIGPLAPVEVNARNQELGLEAYDRILGLRPRLVLVNEMALSSGLIDVYLDAGYEGMLMDRDNVRLALGIDDPRSGDVPGSALSPSGGLLPVLWTDSILFQKLQQVAHGDISEAAYLDYIAERTGRGESPLPLYANDAEVFDFRPGRFETETRPDPEGEWRRLERVLAAAGDRFGLAWVTPSSALQVTDAEPGRVTSAAYPIPVKKQAKYNLARWAVTGRADLWLNTMAHRLTRRVAELDPADSVWRRVCELWASDMRTHLTEQRWEKAVGEVQGLATELGVALGFGEAPVRKGPAAGAGVTVVEQDDGIGLAVDGSGVGLVLNRRRGLTVQRAGFESTGRSPLVGTVPHGYFRSIKLGADFYTGGVVVELPESQRRITDLERVEPEIEDAPGGLVVRAVIDTSLGPIVKEVFVPAEGEWFELDYRFPGWERPRGTVRAGTITLLPDAHPDPISFLARNGGQEPESYSMSGAVDHAVATSSLISSTAGLGATDGRLTIGGAEHGVTLSWDPAASAVFPMVRHEPAEPGPLTRVFFSLLELDDTMRPGGPVGGFRLRVQPRGGPDTP